ncbi:ead/Ea22-like family protein, partial [Enterobacter hormaechei]
MNNIDKRALREAADSVIQKYGSEWFETGRQLCTVHKSKIELIAAANPATVLALLD